MSEKLKPCPFCGEPVEFNKFAEKVVCEDCGATIYSDYWNTRPIEDALNARIAELEAHIAALEEAYARKLKSGTTFPIFQSRRR